MPDSHISIRNKTGEQFAPPRKIKPRKMGFEPPENLEKHWVNGNALISHIANSFTLIFPEGEKFFIRSVKRFINDISNPEVRQEAKAFMGQEMNHYLEHEKFFELFEKQGYDIEPFLKFYKFVAYDVIESLLTDKLHLSTTAGLEHYTALLAELGIENDVLKNSPEIMKDLFYWHAAEEIEHKGVAFDVLQDVDNDYLLRVAGMVLASVLFLVFSGSATVTLLFQDGSLFKPDIIKNATDFFFTRQGLFPKAFKIFLEYFDPDYHPWQKQNSHLADQVFGKSDELLPEKYMGKQKSK